MLEIAGGILLAAVILVFVLRGLGWIVERLSLPVARRETPRSWPRMRKLRAFFVAVTDALVRHKLLAAAVLLLAVLFYFQPNLVTCETYTKKGGFTGMFEFVETTCHLGGPLPPVPPLL